MTFNPYAPMGASTDSDKNNQLLEYMNNIANEQARQFSATQSQQKQKIDNDYQIAKMNAKTAQEAQAADAAYRAAQVQLQQQQLAFDKDKFGQTFQQQAQQFASQLGLSQEQFLEGQRQFNSNLAQNAAQFGITSGLSQQQITNQNNQAQAALAQQMQQFGITSGMTQQQIDAQIQQFGVTSGMTQQQIDNQKAQFAVTSGQSQQQINNQASQFGQTLGLQQGQLGYQMLQTQAQLAQNPADYWQAAELARGVASNPGTATFLTALRNNTRLPMTSVQAGVGPAGSVDYTMGQMGAPSGGQQMAPGAVGDNMYGSPANQGMVQGADGQWYNPNAGPQNNAPVNTSTLQQGGGQQMAPGAVADGGGYLTGQQQGGGMVTRDGVDGMPIFSGPQGQQATGRSFDASTLQGAGSAAPMYGGQQQGGGGLATQYVGARDGVDGGGYSTGQAPGYGNDMQKMYAGGSSSYNEQGGAAAQQGTSQSSYGGYPNAARDAQNLGAIRGIAQAGAQKLGAGALERLSPTEFQMFQSGLGAAGADKNTFLSQYRASRIGNNPAMSRVA